jgi:UDP-N-acetylmuramyl pentapeptide phosphotransferase/UDP-N-acetylglucosamine-1-phosphate transferase
MMDIKLVISFLAALIIGLYSIPKVVKVAVNKGLVAKPNHRTSHTGRIPNVGGISIFISFILAFLIASNFSLDSKMQFLVFTVLVLFFVGLYDDIMIISARRKLWGELFGIAGMIFLGNIRLTNLHGFFGVHEIPYFASVLLTFFVIVVIINAINLIDGIDGLASGVGMIVSLFFRNIFLLNRQRTVICSRFQFIGVACAVFHIQCFCKTQQNFHG